jgi:sensor domain CHASE-containing protein
MSGEKIFGLERANLVIGLLVTLIMLVAGLIGFVWHASQAWTTMQMTQIMDEQMIRNNAEAIKAHEHSIRESQDNFNKLIMIMAATHNRGQQ